MRVLVSALSLLLVASAASAQTRPSTLSMTCAQAAGLVTSQGAVILRTGPHTYDRYVRNRNFCPVDETVEPVWVPTANALQCPIGYRCRSNPLEAHDR